MLTVAKNLPRSSYLDKKQSEKLTPFVKWVGGKRQLLPVIKENLPDFKKHKITNYAEPFVGGGALLFELLNTYEFEKIFINDMNVGLISCYKNIKKNADALISKLSKIQSDYYKLKTLEEKAELYYELRNKYNLLLDNKEDNIDLATYFIALNKTGFNGMYRVNTKGRFNVPFGKHKEPTICAVDNILRIQSKLKYTTINRGDYKECEDFVDNKTFAYFDPPYRPLSQTASFTAYTHDKFDDSEQIELANFSKHLSKDLGVKVMLSNSDPKNQNKKDNFFDDLYSWANVQRVNATRMVNSNAQKRGKISEVLIRSY